ncbi:MAG: hypothetical protein ACQEQH_07600 [Bacillota bacterium]
MKKTLLITIMFLFIFTAFGGSTTYAQFGMVSEYSLSNYTSILMLNDWQMDYLMPIDPAELSKGEYRIYGNAARLNASSNDFFASKISGTIYMGGLDTALRDDLYFHINYDMVPWQSTVEDEKDELRFGMLKMFLDYEFNEDKKVYFGYNHNNYDYKNYDELNEEFEPVENMNFNVMYVGFEIKSSFNK